MGIFLKKIFINAENLIIKRFSFKTQNKNCNFYLSIFELKGRKEFSFPKIKTHI